MIMSSDRCQLNQNAATSGANLTRTLPARAFATGTVTAMAFNPHGHRALSGSTDRTVRVCNINRPGQLAD